ncbi:DeoR/GlpR family DNA-binding transcription regulator [Clostridium cellulovorans]|uniref:Transcriptional regulator, DeoR family n=1 Tax=Clostridium cellulovorans (strain ATCC 35296 / DSM 3052 / OCM 3 / 743B) TaxID=573061 RepID=D9SSZ9_CLOC7|nr:DeoR/GlpR family DNA-binding transcription regulator [Clostridium cellulovorans]ADL52661.1 transcriptional regulator, DeoR family [Clostridium cellulovorans 743B]
MFAEERHQLILDMLEKEKKVIATELLAKLNVSIDTIRRDLMVLEEQGMLKRTRGGAIPKVKVYKPKNFTGRDILHVNPFYHAIAKEAITYINEGDVIYLGGASIDHLMLRYLPKQFNFTVITNSIITADELRCCDNIDIYITCGKVRNHGNMRDAMALEFIKNIRIDTAFISGPCFSANFGLSNTSFEVAALQRAVLEASKKSICLVPNSKLAAEAVAKVVDTRGIDILITDWEAVQEEIDRIKELGVDVILARET